jgi:uncharacterized damage-inducible protein DinB
MNDNTAFHQALIAETRRRILEESIPRLRKCLTFLTEEETWRRPNPHSNSVGNLVLHLCGNTRQWIGSGLGGHPDLRQRQAEFDERGPLPKERLLEQLDEVEKLVNEVLERVRPEDLLAIHPVQVFEESGLSILVHVIEHWSYHVGQATSFTKALKDLDMGYYAGRAL